jgi:hypothetical protein
MVSHAPHVTNAVLELLRPEGLGLEIAPYFDPFLPKGDEFNIFYADYISTEEIRAKAEQNPDFHDVEVPEVDFVWTPGKALIDCFPSGMCFNYAIASHVMEHVPNPIGWVCEILSVLSIGGRLALFLPDRRRNTDYFRNLTTFAELVSWWIVQPACPTPQQIVDFMGSSLDSGKVNGDYSNPQLSQKFRAYTDVDAIQTACFVARHGNYLDLHATVWEPDQFVSVFQRIVDAGLLNVEISTPILHDLEFVIVLTKHGEPRLKAPRKPEIWPPMAEQKSLSERFKGRARRYLPEWQLNALRQLRQVFRAVRRN